MSITLISGTTNIRHVNNPSPVVLESNNAEVKHKIIVAFSTIYMRWALYTDSAQRVTFDMAKFVRNLFGSWEDDFPANTTPDFFICANNFRSVLITAQDVYDGSAEAAASIGTYRFINGGISYQQFNAVDFWDSYFTINAPQYPFLTWRNKSKKKYTTPDAVEFLSYLVPNAYTDISAYIKAWGYDETEILTDIIPLTASYTSGQNKLIRFGCGLGNVDFAPIGLNETDVKFYDIWLEDASEGVISETRRYYVDRKTYTHNHQFLYFNALAGIDTVIMHGEINMTGNITRSILNRYVPTTYSVIKGSKTATNIRGTNSFKASYYPESDYEKLLMQDMLLSPKVAKYEDGMMKPIIITSSKVDYGNAKDSIPLIEFEYTYAFDNTHYTPDF